MNKNKIVMCSIGGVALVASLVLGYLIFAAYTEREEMLEDLESSVSAVQRINSAAISPEQASVEAIEANTKNLTVWAAEAKHIASRGDMLFDASISPEAFKRQLVDEARDEASRPGGVEGKIVKDGFAFGFKDYISGGAMPEREKLAFLQRQWEDVKLITKLLSDAGVIEIVDITIGEKKLPEPEAEQKRGARGKKAEPVVKPQSDEQRFDIKFLARPPAFVRAVNALATAQRFITIDALSFGRAEDALAAALGEKGASAAAAGGGGGRGRGRRGRGAAVAVEAAPEEGGDADSGPRKKGLVVDPRTDVPFTVTMTLTTHDFGDGEDAAQERAARAEKQAQDASATAEAAAPAAAAESEPAPAAAPSEEQAATQSTESTATEEE